MLEKIGKEQNSGFSVLNADELFEINGGAMEQGNENEFENSSKTVMFPQGPTVGSGVK